MDEGNVRLMKVDGKLLAIAIGLPEGTEVVAATNEIFCAGNQIVLRVINPDFSWVKPGDPIPEVWANFCREDGVSKFVGWNDRRGK